MPVMLVFQRTLDVVGAGPAEDRENEESAWNWDHSYWLRLPELESPFATCAFVELEPAWR